MLGTEPLSKVHFSQALALILGWHLFSIQIRHINLYFGGLPIAVSKSVGFRQFLNKNFGHFSEKLIQNCFSHEKIGVSWCIFLVFQRKFSNFSSFFGEISLFDLPENICYDSFFFSISLSLISKVKAVSNSLILVQNIKPKPKFLGH